MWQPSELEVSRDDNDVEDGLTRAPGLGAVGGDQATATTGSRSSTWPRPGCRCRTRRRRSTTSTAPGSTTPRRSTCSARTARPRTSSTRCGAVGPARRRTSCARRAKYPQSVRPLPASCRATSPPRSSRSPQQVTEGQTDRLRPRARAAELAARRRRVHLLADAGLLGHRRHRRAGDPGLPADAARLLRAVRLDDGRDGPDARHPGPGRCRVRGRRRQRAGQARRRAERRARLARAVLPGRRLGGVRADPGRAGVRAAAVGPGGRRRQHAQRPTRAPDASASADPSTGLRPAARTGAARGHQPGGPQPGQRRRHRRRPGAGPGPAVRRSAWPCCCCSPSRA